MDFLKELAELGIIVETKAIEKLKQNPSLLTKIKQLKEKPAILTEIFLKKLENEEPVHEKKEFYTIKDYTDDLIKKYEILRKEIEGKMDKANIVSIGNINEGEVSIIGMVKEIKENSMEVEDLTGSVNVVFSDKLQEKINDLKKDDVVGIHGTAKERTIHADSFIFSNSQ